MNNRGQSLIAFVLILPLICMFLAFFIDSSLSIMEKNKIDGIITSNIKVALDKDLRDTDKIKLAMKDNGVDEVNVIIEEDILKVSVKEKNKSLFGNILKFKWYNFDFHYCGNYIDKKIDKNCG